MLFYNMPDFWGAGQADIRNPLRYLLTASPIVRGRPCPALSGITEQQLSLPVRWSFYSTRHKQVPTYHLMLFAFEVGNLLDLVEPGANFNVLIQLVFLLLLHNMDGKAAKLTV